MLILLSGVKIIIFTENEVPSRQYIFQFFHLGSGVVFLTLSI